MSLSKETNNSVAEMLKMPSHFVIGMYNALRRILEKEDKARKAEEEKQQKNLKMPSMPSINFPSIPKL